MGANGQPHATLTTSTIVVVSVATLGVFWLVWILTSFGAVANNERRTLHTRRWTAVLGLLWTVAVTAHLAWWWQWAEDATFFGGISPYADPVDSFTPLGLAALVTPVPFFVAQLIYLHRAQALFAAAAPAKAALPKTSVLVAFHVLLALAGVPGVGGVLAIAGLAAGTLWLHSMRRALQTYWTGRPGAPSPDGRPPTFTPAQGARRA